MLSDGLCPVVRHASGQILAGVSAVGMLLLARFCLDGRGLWLQVSNERVNVHVNGRPVRRMACLRAGDQVNIEGQDIHVLGRHPLASPALQVPALLRGQGGSIHGMAFALDRNWVAGSSGQADIVLEDKSLPALYVRIQRQGDLVDLQVLGGGAAVLVNGQPCHQASLLAGDQVQLQAGMRLVLEAPEMLLPAAVVAEPADTGKPAVADARPSSGNSSRLSWSWLLLAAIGSAAVLAALLLFGPR
ncbi:MAG: FHA domain-containing protein [Stenotrophomonas sp.]